MAARPRLLRRTGGGRSVGGRVTCVSAARELGLWTPPSDTVPVHVAVPHSASRLPSAVRAHRAVGPVPVAARASVEPLLNVLFHTARCLEPIDALAVWESAIRTGRTEPAHLKRVRWRSRRAHRLAALAGHLSDSGLETRFVELMRRVGVHVEQQVWIDGRPVDGLIGARLVVQSDGWAHHQGRDRRRDIAADARLALLGYTVLRFDYQQLMFDPDLVTRTVLTAMAQGLRLAR
ncbi:endonuclease domain-containing protein [Microbacterium sp. H83]|uniref:endonuclease domain-containing protein n=1 Tax=Microbacterium sp. H83 TaxID=1827324 RepID=UPI001E6281BE|nr:DUF559 domain-containing protein [Microbacterium sp. H83]